MSQDVLSQLFYLREIVGDKMVDLLKIGFKATTRSGRTFLLSITQNIIIFQIYISGDSSPEHHHHKDPAQLGIVGNAINLSVEEDVVQLSHYKLTLLLPDSTCCCW